MKNDIERVDWPALIQDMVDRGETQHSIAAAVGCAQPQIWRLRHGVTAEPLYCLGRDLIDLHRRVMRRKRRVA